MNRNEKQSKKRYDTIAACYDKTLDGKLTAKFKDKILKLCDIPFGGKVLDVGCGNGALINEVYKRGGIQAYGVDISPNMIKECRMRYEEIVFEVSNGEALNFKDNSFDTVIICCVLHHLNNPINFMREAQRVLKKGGFLIIGEPYFAFGIKQIFDNIVSPLLRWGDNKLFSHKKLKKLLTENGFSITEIYKKGMVQIIKGGKI